MHGKTERPLFVPVILGTARQGRESENAARFVFERTRTRAGVETELIDVRNLSMRLDDAVRLRLVSDVSLGCFMSGGIDSTAIAATAARLHPGIRTFSVGYTEPRFDERPFARLAAERLGTRHEELLVTPEDARALLPDLGPLLDEPIADMSFLPLYLLSRAARRSVTVALTGDGGDELFGGYAHYRQFQRLLRLQRLPRPLLQITGVIPCSRL